MKSDDWLGIVIIAGIIGIALFGGAKGGGNGGLITSQNPNPNQSQAQNQAQIEYKIRDAEYKAAELQKQVQAEADKKNQSRYYGMIDLGFVNRSTDPKQEYISLQASYAATTAIPVSGWTLKSLSSGTSVNIPKGAYIYYSGMANSEDNIYLNKGEMMYVVTGMPPNGTSFKVNKCSGYLNQFQTYVPYLNSNCPLPRNENLSSIPRTVINDACFDYIDRFPACRIQTDPLPVNWSTECSNFIYYKITYSSCVDAHKNDRDFYGNEWRVYLKHTESIWKSSREEIVLYDDVGKIVDTLKY